MFPLVLTQVNYRSRSPSSGNITCSLTALVIKCPKVRLTDGIRRGNGIETEATQVYPLPETQSLDVVQKKLAKQSRSPNCSLQFTAASLPTAVPKGPIQLRSEFVNPSDTPHVRIVTARIVHRTLKLSRKSCQALERYIRWGLCCTLETEVSQGQGWPNPGKKCWDFEGIKAAAVGHGTITDNPTSGEVVSHNCMILR